MPLAPQKTNRRKSWWAWTQIETGETVRPLRFAVRVVPVHLDSNLQRGRFRPCVDGMLAKTFGQGGDPGQLHGVPSELLDQ